GSLGGWRPSWMRPSRSLSASRSGTVRRAPRPFPGEPMLRWSGPSAPAVIGSNSGPPRRCGETGWVRIRRRPAIPHPPLRARPLVPSRSLPPLRIPRAEVVHEPRELVHDRVGHLTERLGVVPPFLELREVQRVARL